MRRTAWHLPVGLGGFGFLAAFAGSWIPSFWGDEAASVISAERTLPSLFGMLRHVDAVHGAYYLFVHFWIQVFGATQLSVRLPSAIAVGAVVAGTFVLGRMLASRNVGIVAALIVSVIPRTSYMGADARSYAMATAVAVWSTVLLLVLLRRRFASRIARRLAWLGYAVAIAAGVYVFLYLGLLLIVHAAFLFSSRSHRDTRGAWLSSAATSTAMSLPILGLGFAQRGQIAFLADRGHASPRSVLVTQWFGNPFLAAVAWTLIVIALVGAYVLWHRTRTLSPLIRMSMAWTVAPTLVLLGLNTITPAYNLRYLSFCVPGVVLAVTAGLWTLRHRVVRIALIVAVIACAIPTDVIQRGPFAKDGGSDLAQVAAIIGQEAKPGDGIIFDRTTANRQRPRLALYLYPDDFVGLNDVALKASHLDRAMLWDTSYPTSAIVSRLDAIDHVWVVELEGSPDNLNEIDVQALTAAGYTVTSTRLAHRSIVYEFTK